LPRASPAQVRSQLARFGLDSERAETRVGSLSGGEKARLLLALATRDAPQLLILDEPTNHLDIDAREALVRALSDYQGAVILITHDPHLVDLVADRLWLVADGGATPFDGDLDDYRAWLADRARPLNAKAEAGDKAGDRKARAAARAALAPLRRRAQDAEKTIAKLAEERAAIEAKLANPRLYAGAGKAVEIALANARLSAIAREIAAAEETWLEAQAALEEAD
jgi:ATP-binding cassette subfamily F protein 3